MTSVRQCSSLDHLGRDLNLFCWRASYNRISGCSARITACSATYVKGIIAESWHRLLHNSIMAEKHPKRPRDLNQWAKRMVDIATGAASDREPTPEEQGKDPAAVARGRLGGAKGGKARAKKLSASERRASALKAVRSRWSRS
jgi:hypothetical protein